MDVEWVIAGVTGFVILLYLYLTWNYDYWRKRGIPQLKPFPGVGAMMDVLRLKKGLHQAEIDIYYKFAGHKACGYYSFRQPVLMVRDPELIKTVLVKDFSSFHDNASYVDENVDPIIAKNPFFTRGSRWKTIRSQIAPSFTAAKFKPLFLLVKDNFKHLNKYIDDHIGEEIEAKQMTDMSAVDNVASVAYGIEGGSFSEGTRELYKFGKEMIEKGFVNPIFTFCRTFFPKAISLLKLRIVPNTVAEYFESLIKQTEAYREKNNVIRNDFLQLLLNLRKESKKDNAQEYTYEDIIAHCLTFFVDGFETSSTMASFALHELVVNPDIQGKLRHEILSVNSRGEDIDYETLVILPYLDKVILETLRKYPLYTLNKLCTSDTTLEIDGKSVPIERGTMVTLPLYGIHHNPEYYENPEVFDPERFSELNIASRHPYTFFPFGDGPRKCLGFRFALLQIKSILYDIVSNYRILRCERTVDKVNLDPLSPLLKSLDGLWMRFEKL